MQTTPVTQGQWEAVMGNNPSYFSNCGDDCPVEQVSWHDAQAFITALNHALEGTTRYALPTEAQWEYAARAGSTTAFANGEITHTGSGYDPVLDSMGWYIVQF
jgi:formylglycine-generating enzyme required for sulfatase activity